MNWTDRLSIEEILVGIKWTDVLSGVSSLATVFASIFAYRALHTWKRGTVLQKSLNTLDSISESTISISRNFSQALSYMEILHISIDAFEKSEEKNCDFSKSGLVNYIKNSGKDDSVYLKDILSKNIEFLNELELQIVHFQRLDSDKSLPMMKLFGDMTTLHKKLQSFASIIGSPHLYWKNPTVEATVRAAVEQDTKELKKLLNQTRDSLLKAVEVKYQALIS